jgi:glycosyltransferase involved in cell wall biosynthesis
MSGRTPTITVVVCTRNRADRLDVALGSLAHLETDGRFSYEVLVVDNGSTDDTPAAVKRIAANFPVALRRVFEERPAVGRARNRGVAEAFGEWIAFFDDDQAADPRWLAELLALAERKGVRCVGGQVRLKLPPGIERDLSPVCRMLLGCSVDMPTERRYTPSCTPGAGNLMVHRTVFTEVGAFDEACSRGEDTDLFVRMYKAGIEAWYSPDAAIDHVIPPERLTDDFLLRLSDRMGTGMAEDEYAARGPKLYPLIWLARLAQASLALWPRLMLARLRRHREATLGARCRLRIAKKVLEEGYHLIGPAFRETLRLTRPTTPLREACR